MFLVQASNVTIDHLKVDGDNPALNAGFSVGGANVDARNGIITDHQRPATRATNLSVHDVTIKNIFLRGIYASSGGTFNFTNNTVNNVQADPSLDRDLHLRRLGRDDRQPRVERQRRDLGQPLPGTTFTEQHGDDVAERVHTDNAGDAGGAADVISGNNVVGRQRGLRRVGVRAVPDADDQQQHRVGMRRRLGRASRAAPSTATNDCPGAPCPTVLSPATTVTTTAAAGAPVCTSAPLVSASVTVRCTSTPITT